MRIDEIWTEKYRPQKLEDIILSEENRTYFSSLSRINNNYLFLGHSGTGKNTLAYYLRDKFAPNSTLYINASSESGIDVVRNKITDFISTTSFDGSDKLVILSEFDGFSVQGQQALREIMEQYLNSVHFIISGNYRNKIINEIHSRCQTFDFTLNVKDISKRVVHILKEEKISNWEEHKKEIGNIIKRYYPDVRKTINELQKSCITGKFIIPKTDDNQFAEKVWEMIKSKTNAFEIRKFVIDNDQEFDNDYHQLMRKLFDFAVQDANLGACLLISDHMAKHTQVMDTEVNFSGLIFNLTKLK